MDPVTIALGLASVIPSAVRWLAGDNAGDVADTVITTAKRITGLEDGAAAAASIHASPELQALLQREWQAHELALYQAENARIESVNATMREEAKSEHWAQWLWRPFNGFCFAVTMFGCYFVLPLIGKAAPVVPESALMAWGAVLGVTAWHRGQQKRRQ